jgi:hypothetical protein
VIILKEKFFFVKLSVFFFYILENIFIKIRNQKIIQGEAFPFKILYLIEKKND